MQDGPGGCDFEGAVRRAFVDLVFETLPAAACVRGWPVTTPAGFERLLLDHVLGSPFETRLSGPSGASAGVFDLLVAVEVAGRILEGRCCVAELDRRSRALRAAAEEPCASAAPLAPVRRPPRAAR
jgi:hypothetical protein